MRRPWQTGVLAISVDLEALHLAQHHAPRRGRNTVARLLDLFARHRLPVTWSLSNPAQAAHGEVLAIGPHHELALRGDPSWDGGRIGKVRMAMEISRRLAAARQAGIAISSLALQGDAAAGELPSELVAPHGISALWNAVLSPAAFHKACLLRPNLWYLPVTIAFPSREGWLASNTESLHRAIRGAVQQRDLIHLALDAARLDQPSVMAAVALAVRQIAATREKGGLDVMPLARVAADLSRTKQSTPSRSIFRAA
jgi:uncharacterized protein YndB with AHSA1/START domain